MDRTKSLDRFVQVYGDLLYDLCFWLGDSSAQAQALFRAILRDLERGRKSAWGDLERAWVLGVAYRRTRKMIPAFSPHLANSEQIHLDSAEGVATRMKRLGDFFKLLPREEKWILLLHDKHQIPLFEIASAMSVPPDSLQFTRKSALVALEEKVWLE